MFDTEDLDVEGFDDQGTDIGPQPGPQTILLATDCEEVFFGGALAAGKSFALGLDFENHHQLNAKKGKKVGGIIFRSSVPELDDLINTFKEILEPFGWLWLEGKKVFKHEDGSWCRMRHVKDDREVKKYWGHAYTYMAYDELGDASEKTFEAVMKLRAARLRSSAGVSIRFVGTGNPCGAGHKMCKERYIDPAPEFTPFKDKKSKHNIIFIPGRMENNVKMLLADPEYRERCKSLGPEWYVNALINGDWSINPEGKIFHREWMGKTFNLANPPNFWLKFVSWDTAFKTTKDSARSACTVWGATDNALYLLYAFADKLEFPALISQTKMIYERYRPHYVWVEDKASGPSLVQSLKAETTMPLRAIDVDGDKQRRAFVVTPFFESGKIFLPESAPWKLEYVEELCAFPAPSAYADYVDSTSQALTQFMKLDARRKKWGDQKVVNLNGSPYGV